MGLVLFTDRVEKFIPPKKGKRHVLRVIRELLSFEPRHKGTDIAEALKFLSSITKRRTVTFLVSDFLSEGYERSLRVASRRHDIIAITLRDPREKSLPPLGFLELEDAESEERVVVATRSGSFRRAFETVSGKDLETKERYFRSIHLDSVRIETDKPYFEPLVKFFKMRERRR